MLDSFQDSVGLQLGEPTALAGPHGNVPVGLSGQSLLDAPVAGIGKDIGFRTVQERLGLGDVVHIGRCDVPARL